MGTDREPSPGAEGANAQPLEAMEGTSRPRPDPDAAQAHLGFARQCATAVDWEGALRHMERAIALDPAASAPKRGDWFSSRAAAFGEIGNPIPLQALAQYKQAQQSIRRGDYDAVISAYAEAASTDPPFFWASNDLAWFLVTCDETRVRNGGEAIRWALEACQRSAWICWSCIDTLAAAYAEVEAFDQAIEQGSAAFFLAPNEQKDEMAAALQHYKQGKRHPAAERATAKFQPFFVCRGHKGRIFSLAVSLDGGYLASGSADGTARVWRIYGKEIRRLPHENSVRSVLFSPDGDFLFSGDEKGVIRKWDVELGIVRAVFEGHGQAITALCLFDNGRKLISGSEDTTVRVWDTETGKETTLLYGHRDAVGAVGFHADRGVVVSSGQDRTLRLWDPDTGALLQRSKDTCVGAFSDDGHYGLAYLHPDQGFLDVLETARSRRISRFPSIRSEYDGGFFIPVVHGMALAPDGRTAVTVTGDHVVRLWDTASGRERLAWEDADACTVTFAPSGDALLLGAFGGVLKWFDLSEELLAEDAAQNSPHAASLEHWKDRVRFCAEQAGKHLERYEPELALPYLTELIGFDNGTAGSYYARGKVYLALGRPVAAIADLSEAIRLGHVDADVFLNRDNAYSRVEQFAEAIADYSSALRLDSRLAAALAGRGKAQVAMEDHLAAIADLSEAIHLGHADAEMYLFRGDAHCFSGHHEQALADYSEVIRLDPACDRAYLARSFVRSLGEDTAQALSDLEECLRLNPKNAFAYNLRGSLLFRQGDLDDAIADFTMATQFDPQCPGALFHRGLAHCELGNYNQAVADLSLAIRLDPANANAYHYRSLAYRGRGDEEPKHIEIRSRRSG